MHLLAESWSSMATETKETPQGTFHDALTGKTVVRDLTSEEIAENETSYIAFIDVPSPE